MYVKYIILVLFYHKEREKHGEVSNPEVPTVGPETLRPPDEEQDRLEELYRTGQL